MKIDISNMTIQFVQNTKSWIDILSALLTPAVAILTGLIAYLQWRTNERKRKQDLFDMRYDNLYLPIFMCIEKITQIKGNRELSLEDKGKIVQEEIQKFWQQFCKYKFLISNEDSENLSQKYNGILNIIQKYDYKNMDSNENSEEFLSIVLLMLSLTQMERILTKYLRVEPDSIVYKVKCWLSNQKNKLISSKQIPNSVPVTENQPNNEGCSNE